MSQASHIINPSDIVSAETKPAIEPLIGLAEAARILNCHPLTVSRRAERKEIPAMKIGNRWKFRASALDNWINGKLFSSCSNQGQEGH